MSSATDLHVADLNVADLLVGDANPMNDGPAAVDLSRSDLTELVDLSPVPGPAKLAFSTTGFTMYAPLGNPSGTVDITLENVGSSPSGTITVGIGGDTLSFRVEDHCGGTSLQSGATCTQTVYFWPKSPGPLSVTVNASSTPGGAVSYQLVGQDCGQVGQPCCSGSCVTGVCDESTCVAYGGTFNLPANIGCTGPSGGCSGHGLGATSCACISAFNDVEILSAPFWCASSNTADQASIHLCQSASRSATTDWAGAYEMCGSSCSVENAYTGDCSCPAGATATVFPIQNFSGCTPAAITICGVNTAPMVSYGGAYQKQNTDACQVANPRTGDCSCPSPSVAVGAAVLDRGVSSATDGAHIYFCQVEHPVPSPSPY